MPSILQGGKKPMPMAPAKEEGHMPMHDGGGEGEQRSTLVSHGDGTHHIEHEDGSTTEHGHIGHALMHLAGKHSEGLHHHTHSDGMGGGHTVHKVAHGGEAEGPEEHDNLDSVKGGMDDFFDEAEEPEDKDYAAPSSKEPKDYD